MDVDHCCSEHLIGHTALVGSCDTCLPLFFATVILANMATRIIHVFHL